MVRLVFRPYTQVGRTICTSVSLRASIRVSSDFTLPKHSSPSFGSQHICSNSFCSLTEQSVDLAAASTRVITSEGVASVRPKMTRHKCHINVYFRCAMRSFNLFTRIYVRLLGPCFKTGRFKPFRQQSWALRMRQTIPQEKCHKTDITMLSLPDILQKTGQHSPKGRMLFNWIDFLSPRHSITTALRTD